LVFTNHYPLLTIHYSQGDNIVTELTDKIETSGITGGRTKTSNKGILWLLFACVLWGTVGVSSALLNRVETTPPQTVGFLRLIFSLPLLLGLAWFSLGRRNPLKINARNLPLCLGMGLAMAGYQLFYFAAIPISSVTLVVVIALCSAPIIVAVLSIPIFKERLTSLIIFSLILGLGGTLLLAFGGNNGSTTNSNANYLLGAILALGAGFSYSALTILSRIAAKRTDSNASQFIAIAFTFGAVLLLIAAIATGSLKLDLAPGVWLIAAYLGIVPTGLAYIIFVFALKSVSATVTTIITLLEPAIAALLAWLLLGETITLLTIGGAGLLVASVYLLSRR
jgi:drug/metabolite transporter, DME family